MRTLAIVLMVLHGFAALGLSMYMPEDTEILDGYVLDDGVDQISPEDMYFEVRSLTGLARRPIRNKREAKYEVLQSAGLASHFLPKSTFKKPSPNDNVGSVLRVARSVSKDPTTATETENKTDATEELPKAEKQSAADQTGFASDIMDRWTTAPFEYTKLQRPNSEDSMAQNGVPAKEGVKGRTPRVHFVTQQKKPAEDKFTMMMMGGDLNVASANKADSYKSARTERLEEDSRGYLPNRFSGYDMYNRRYDR